MDSTVFLDIVHKSKYSLNQLTVPYIKGDTAFGVFSEKQLYKKPGTNSAYWAPAVTKIFVDPLKKTTMC